MFKILFGLVAALLFYGPASAALSPTSGFSCYAPSFPAWGTFTDSTMIGCATKLADVGKAAGSIHPAQNVVCGAGYGEECGTAWDTGPAHSGNLRVTAAQVCPANSTLSGASCSCDTGYAELGGQCVATTAQCPIGQGRTFNRTEGWARTPNADANDMVSTIGPVSSLYGYNDGVCIGNITSVDRCFRSQEPSAQGLYRVSCDYTMVNTETATSGGDAAASPETPNASCPGFVGEVNGKTVCVGTASSPLPSGSAPPNYPTSPGNPSAGVKPATGEGSGSTGAGRTPTTGAGGNAGGPAGAAVGRGGTGDRGEPGEDATAVCGAPPLPSCNVKVDEAGVPAEGTASQRFQQGLTDLAQIETNSQARINDAKASDLPDWSWTFALPTGCAPYAMEAFGLELDICQFQPIIHDIMSFLWLSAGVFGLLALFRQSVGT